MKRIFSLVIINIAAIALLGLTTRYFLTTANLVNLIDNMALEAIVLSGYVLLLVGGFFDLSVDGIVALTGILAGLMMLAGIPWYLAATVALLIAGGIGIFNGIIVAKVRINGLIATLTTWWVCIGIALGFTKGVTPFGFPEAFQMLGQTRLFGFRIIVFYAIATVVILTIVLHFTRTGSRIYVSGDNREAAQMMGVNTTKLGVETYALVGFLAGVVGLLTASRMNAASPVAVDGMTLRIIAASVIGGCGLSGGKGSIIGGVLGLLLMSILSNAIIQLGISPYWQKAVLGSILLIVALSEQLHIFRKRRN